jgi:hypothetical protein
VIALLPQAYEHERLAITELDKRLRQPGTSGHLNSSTLVDPRILAGLAIFPMDHTMVAYR